MALNIRPNVVPATVFGLLFLCIMSFGGTSSSEALEFDLTFRSDKSRNHPDDPGGVMLQSIMEAAAARWEAIFPGLALTIKVDYYWNKMDAFGRTTPELIGSGFTIKFSPYLDSKLVNYFMDETPDDDSEYAFISPTVADFDGRMLYSDISSNNLPSGSDPWFTEALPNDFEIVYRGKARKSEVASSLDLLTIAMHELGHTLLQPENAFAMRINGYLLSPSLTGASTLSLARIKSHWWPIFFEYGPHVVAPCLMGLPAVYEESSNYGYRHLPSQLDVVLAATARGVTSFRIPRQELVAGGSTLDWASASIWDADLPEETDDVLMGSAWEDEVILSTNVEVKNLILGYRSDSPTAARLLTVEELNLSVREALVVEGSSSSPDLTKVVVTGGYLSAFQGAISGAMVELSEISSAVITQKLYLCRGSMFLVITSGLQCGESIQVGYDDGTSSSVLALAGGLVKTPFLHLLHSGAVVSGSGAVFDLQTLTNEGVLRAQNGTLIFNGSGGESFDLDGDETGQLDALNGSIYINGALKDPFSSIINVGALQEVKSKQDFLLDDGANVHLTGDEAAFRSLAACEFGAGAILQAAGDECVVASPDLTFAEAAISLADYSSLFVVGPTTYRSGTYTGDATLYQQGDVFVESNTVLEFALYVWDGEYLGYVTPHTTQIQNGVTLQVTGQITEDPASDGFDGNVVVKAGAVLDLGMDWTLEGTLTLEGGTVRGGALRNEGSITGWGRIETDVDNRTSIAGTGTGIVIAGSLTGPGSNSGVTVYSKARLSDEEPNEPIPSLSAPIHPALLAHSPNPMLQATRLRFVSDVAGTAVIEIFSVLGARVRVQRVEMIAGLNEVSFERGDLGNGMYVYRISWPGFSASRKLVVR